MKSYVKPAENTYKGLGIHIWLWQFIRSKHPRRPDHPHLPAVLDKPMHSVSVSTRTPVNMCISNIVLTFIEMSLLQVNGGAGRELPPSGNPDQPVSGASSSNEESPSTVRPRIRTSGMFLSEILSWNVLICI